MSPEWSSSITIGVGAGELVGERLASAGRGRDTRVGLCARGCRNTADRLVAQRVDELGDDRALVVDVDADDVGAELVEQVEQRRERRVLDDHPVAEAHDDLGDAVERVHRPVDHGERLGRERPAIDAGALSSSGSTGWSR